MTSDLHRAKRPASRALAGPYGHPLHPLLVTLPIGAWTASLVFDLASHLVSGPAFLARGSLWLIAIGIVGALAAAVAGFLDLVVIPSGTPAARTAIAHMALMLTVTGAYLGNAVWRHDLHSRGPVPPGPLALSVASLAVLAVGGFLGGKLAFGYGVRVAAEADQAAGFARRSAGTPAPDVPAPGQPAGTIPPAPGKGAPS